MAENYVPKDNVAPEVDVAPRDDVVTEGNVTPKNDAVSEDNVVPKNDAIPEDNVVPKDEPSTSEGNHDDDYSDDDILVPGGDIALLATGGNDDYIKLWDVQTGVPYRNFKYTTQVNALEITPDRQYLTASGYGQIQMFDLHSNQDKPLLRYKVSNGLYSTNVSHMRFSNNGNWMFASADDGLARGWDLRCRTNRCQITFQGDSRFALTGLRLHPNQIDVIVGNHKGVLYVWDVRTNKAHEFVEDLGCAVNGVAISPSGNLVVSGNRKGYCCMWQFEKGNKKLLLDKKFKYHSNYITHCEFSPNSLYLATSSADQTACVWKTNTDTLEKEFKIENQKWVWTSAFTDDCESLFTVSSDGMPRLWNIKSGNIVREYKGHKKAPIYALVFRDAT